MRTTGTPAILEERRQIAARMFKSNMDSEQIAKLLNVHCQTVRRWKREYRTGGLKALSTRMHRGPPFRLNPEQKQELLGLLAETPQSYGFAPHLWTTRLVSQLILDRFGVAYHHDHVGVILHRLGYSYQRPALRARERDEARIAAWRQETWPAIVKRSRERHATIVFADEAGFRMIPLVKKQWAQRGQTPVVKHRNRWFRKVSVIGGLAAAPDGDPLQVYLDWYPGSHVDQDKVVMFLKHLVKQIPGKITVLWDNLSSHKGPKVRRFLSDHPQVELCYLPPYAPELNPIESLWCMSKYHRMANLDLNTLDDLESTARNAVGEVTQQQNLLDACIRHSELHYALYPSRDQ